MTFIDGHKDRRVDGGLRWGIEPICEVLTERHLPIASATYYAAKTRPPAARAVRYAELLRYALTSPHRDRSLTARAA